MNDTQRLTETVTKAVELFYETVKNRKMKEFLEEIKNGGQNEKYKGIQA